MKHNERDRNAVAVVKDLPRKISCILHRWQHSVVGIRKEEILCRLVPARAYVADTVIIIHFKILIIQKIFCGIIIIIR